MNPPGSGALPNRWPYLEPEDDERCRAKDDAERRPRQLLSRGDSGELHLQEFEIVRDGVPVTRGLIDLAQRELALV